MQTSNGFQDLLMRRLIYPQGHSYFLANGTPPPSHDTTSASYHVTQASFLLQLDLAVQAAWHARHRSKYVDVKVLLMSWSSDDLGVEPEVQGLLSVFRDLYHFDCEYWKIPDRDAGREATKKVISHMEKTSSSPDNLCIFYYAGHASKNPHFPGGLPTWAANRSPNSPKFDSSCIQPHLCHVDDQSPDVLLLYDSCFPANGQGSIESGRAVIELLAACGFEMRAPEVGRDSFTYCLIQELADAASRATGISVPELHRRQICRLQSWKPNVLLRRDEQGETRVCLDEDGVAVFEHPVRRTPIHCQLSLNDRPRAIVLSPLPAKSDGSATPGGFFDLTPEHNSTAKTKTQAGNNDPSQIHVALRVSLKEDDFNEAEFRDWLCSAPARTKAIKILGVLPSCSTMLLIQVPVEVWDLLPPSPAIAFIGWVREDNHTKKAAVTPCRAVKVPCAVCRAVYSISTSDSISTSAAPQQNDKGKDRAVAFQLGQEADETALSTLEGREPLIRWGLPMQLEAIDDPGFQISARKELCSFPPYNDKLEIRADSNDTATVSTCSETSCLWSGSWATTSTLDGVDDQQRSSDPLHTSERITMEEPVRTRKMGSLQPYMPLFSWPR